jgi:hypothetical protein
MTGMDQHEQAIIAHETMTNGSADAHQKMVESHQKMMGTGTVIRFPSVDVVCGDE